MSEHGTDLNGHTYNTSFVSSFAADPATPGGFIYRIVSGTSPVQTIHQIFNTEGQFDTEFINFRAASGPGDERFAPPGLPVMKYPIRVGQMWDIKTTSDVFKNGTQIAYPGDTSESTESIARIVGEGQVTFEGRQLQTYTVDAQVKGQVMNFGTVVSTFTRTEVGTYVPAYAFYFVVRETDVGVAPNGHKQTDSFEDQVVGRA